MVLDESLEPNQPLSGDQKNRCRCQKRRDAAPPAPNEQVRDREKWEVLVERDVGEEGAQRAALVVHRRPVRTCHGQGNHQLELPPQPPLQQRKIQQGRDQQRRARQRAVGEWPQEAIADLGDEQDDNAIPDQKDGSDCRVRVEIDQGIEGHVLRRPS